MTILKTIQKDLADLLDIEEDEITPEAYVVRDLDAESIDLLEMAVALNTSFGVEINDDEVFLRLLRDFLAEAAEAEENPAEYLEKKYSFLTRERIEEILSDLDAGPVLKVKDMASYIEWKIEGK